MKLNLKLHKTYFLNEKKNQQTKLQIVFGKKYLQTIAICPDIKGLFLLTWINFSPSMIK